MSKPKKLLIILAAAVIVVFVTFPAIYDWYYPLCPGCERSTVNSNAKLVFTNSATYITKCGTKNKYLPDGIYFGELSNKDVAYKTVIGKSGETFMGVDFSADYNGTYDDYAVFMNEIMGGPPEYEQYYAVVFSDGLPKRAYCSLDKKFRKYQAKMETSYRKGTLAEDFCYIEDFGSIYVGRYPDALSTR